MSNNRFAELSGRVHTMTERLDSGLKSLEASLHGAQTHAHGVLREYVEKGLAKTPGCSRTYALRFDLEKRALRLRSDTDALKKIYTEWLTDLKDMKKEGAVRGAEEFKDATRAEQLMFNSLLHAFEMAIIKAQANVDMCEHFDVVINEMEEITTALD